jgi:hypothetical protein
LYGISRMRTASWAEAAFSRIGVMFAFIYSNITAVQHSLVTQRTLSSAKFEQI